MTKYRAVSVVLMSILIAAVIVLCALSQSIQNKRAAAKTEESSTLPQVDYVLGEYEGYLAVFRGEQQKPYQVLQMPVQLLPEEDQGAIRSRNSRSDRAGVAAVIRRFCIIKRTAGSRNVVRCFFIIRQKIARNRKNCIK